MNKRKRNILSYLAEKANKQERFAHQKICAAIVHRNQIISEGFNRDKTHPIAAHYLQYQLNKEGAIYLHAEMDAIRKIYRPQNNNIYKDCTLYVSRILYPNSKRNNYYWANCIPCDGCMNLIKDVGIKKIIFTMNNDDMGELKISK